MGFWTGEKYGKWFKDKDRRMIEEQTNKASKEELKDGLIYYRKLLNLLYFIVLIGVVVGFAFGLNVSEDMYGGIEADREDAIADCGKYICKLQNEDHVRTLITNGENVIVYCSSHSYAIPD